MENYILFAIPILLSFIGALIALAKCLLIEQPLKPRFVVGSTILGAATSAIAGGVLHFVPNLSPPAIVALGCVLGLMGHAYIEGALKKSTNIWIDKKKREGE